MTDELRRTIDLKCSSRHAFRIFTEMTDLWWPKGHRKNSDGTPDGAEWTIGEITAYNPPETLEFDWYPGSPTTPTAVSVRFEGDRGRSRIIITHRALSAPATDIWPERVALFERGWDIILPALQTYCAENPEHT